MLDRNVHKTILLQILKDIYTDTSLGPVLGFKGGTAANLFYDLGRFSVDLDLDLLEDDKQAFVFERIEKILRGYGTIKEKHRKRHTLFFVLSYDEKAQSIKVEINRRTFGSRYELKNYLGISMLVMVREDMFAHKLVALLERTKTANRDVYDLWHFLQNRWPINKEIIEKRTKMSFAEHLKKCITFVESLSDRNILSGIGELLDEKQKAWARTQLRKDTIFLLKVRLEQAK
ncbi:MAG: nucleotidyl transferase AbiEii/AbiGii toxin family protein [Clostridiales bacterium]|nr:nucleotidyl transferase AbiEii/AbiGii toxin family protein [Clostridiales bacterium]